MVVSAFSVLKRKYPYVQIYSEIPKLSVKLKFCTYNNLNIQNPMTFTLSLSHQKYPFWVILVPKFKIVSFK